MLRRRQFCRLNLSGQGRDRTGDLPLFRRTLVPTELPGRKAPVLRPGYLAEMATLTGLEPATSAVTGRRANQLRHRALLYCYPSVSPPGRRTPNGIRTRATAVKGRRPRPLNDGGLSEFLRAALNAGDVGSFDSLGHGSRKSQTGCSPALSSLPPPPVGARAEPGRQTQYPFAPRPYSSVGRATDF